MIALNIIIGVGVFALILMLVDWVYGDVLHMRSVAYRKFLSLIHRDVSHSYSCRYPLSCPDGNWDKNKKHHMSDVDFRKMQNMIQWQWNMLKLKDERKEFRKDLKRVHKKLQ